MNLQQFVLMAIFAASGPDASTLSQAHTATRVRAMEDLVKISIKKSCWFPVPGVSNATKPKPRL